MKKPTPVYFEKYSETAAKLIDDYTAEQCLYSLQRYCLKHPGCFGCTLLNKYGECDIMQSKLKPYEWRLNK